MKKKLLLFTAAISIVAAYAVLFFFGGGKQFIINDADITAAEVDLEDVFSPQDSTEAFDRKTADMTAYFKSNGINTAIIRYNSGNHAVDEVGGFAPMYADAVFARDGRVLSALKKPLEDAGIQIILELDCAELTKDQISHAVEELAKNYKFAGILLTDYNFDNENLQHIKMELNRKFRDYYFGIKTEDTENAKQLDSYGVVDFYIFENITDKDYISLKATDFKASSLILSCKTADFEKNLFILSNFSHIDGLVLTQYTGTKTDLSLYRSMMDNTQPLTKFSLAADSSFAVSNPSKDTETYAQGIYVAGIANPAQPVFVNGQQAVQGKDGSFGLYVELSKGENTIEITQGEDKATRIVTRKEQNSTSSKIKYDDTKRAYKGQVVQTTDTLTSILHNVDYDSAIMDGVPQGVQMVVEKSVRTQRNGEYTWAYILSNGGYILAENVEWVNDTDYIPSCLDTYNTVLAEDGNFYFNLDVSGKPAVISDFSDNTITFNFLNVSAPQTDDAEEAEKVYITDSLWYTLETEGENMVVTLSDDIAEIWGYNVEYKESELSQHNSLIEIHIKYPPSKQKGAKPLEGVTIMLDAGHGDSDPGALAMGGISAPDEKDINLAVSLATKICLEKLGATVYLTREDDTFLTLDQRLALVNQIKPDLFIAQHHNSMNYTVDANGFSGVECYYFTQQSAPFAEIMAERVSAATQRTNRGYYHNAFRVLRNDIAPGVLMEYGFVINPQEYAALYNDADIYRAAFATAQAVMDFIPE